MSSRSRLLRSLALACALFAGFAGPEAATAESEPTVLQLIDRNRTQTWRWQRLMRVRPTPTRYAERTASEELRQLVLEYWRAQARRARYRAYHPPRLSAWLCIHRYEGPWNANTGNGYYGGLQMDITFQRQYGPDLLRWKCPAHRWLAIELIWVAERAYRSGRGFYPWPTAARRCGLV